MVSAKNPGLVVMPPPQFEVKEYLSAPQMYALYGMSSETFYRLRNSVWLPDPDVVVGRQGGWTKERAVRFGRETGRLDENNRPSTAFRRGKPPASEEPPEWYRKIPDRYMSGQEAALFMGMNKDGMFRLKRRNDYPRPTVRVGPPGEREILGWTHEECLRFALRRGYLNQGQVKELMRELDIPSLGEDSTPGKSA